MRKCLRAMRAMWYAATDAAARAVFAAPRVELRAYRRILAVRDDCLGDVMTTLPALATLKRSFPDAEIDCLVRPSVAPLLAGHPDVHAVFVDAAALPRDYDCAIAFAPGFSRNRLLKRVGATVRVGWGGTGGSRYLTHVYADDRDARPRHEVVSCLEMAALAGAHARSTAMRLAVQRHDDATAGTYVVIHAGASKAYLRWPAEKYARLALRLRERLGIRAVFTGSPADVGIEERLRAALPKDAAFVVAFDLSVERLAALYAGAAMYVGNLTGPMHLAAACGVPCVAVSVMKDNRDDGRYWAPWGVPYAIVGNADARGGHPADYDAAAAVTAVSEETVCAAVVALWERVHA